MRALQLGFFLVGCAALGWLVHRIGLDRLLAGLAGVGWGFAVTCAAHLGGLLLDSVVLRATAGAPGRDVPYAQFARASVAGHAINEATPFGKVGEVTKFAILSERLEPARAAGALVSQNILSFVVNCALIALGAPVAIGVFGVDGAAAAVFAAVSGAFFLAGLVGLVILRRGLGTWPFALLRRAGVGRVRLSLLRVARWQDGWERVEASWKEATASPRRIRVAWAASVTSRLANVGETALLLHLLGGDQVLAAAVLSLGASQAVSWTLSFVPLQAGTAEGGAYLVFSAAGLPPATGVLVELARKLRRVLFIGLGVTILGLGALRRAPR